jgi:hypothetical protein
LELIGALCSLRALSTLCASGKQRLHPIIAICPLCTGVASKSFRSLCHGVQLLPLMLRSVGSSIQFLLSHLRLLHHKTLLAPLYSLCLLSA